MGGNTQNDRNTGANITLFFKDQTKVSQEIYSGSSYMSQSGKTLWFGIGKKTPDYAEVKWPNGMISKHKLNKDINKIIKLNIASIKELDKSRSQEKY